MSSLLERPRTRKPSASALSHGLPQVNLLPPEVRAARGLKAIQRWLVIGLGVVLVLCIGVYGLAKVDAGSADSQLSKAQDETARLQAEQAKYAEVPLVQGALSSAQSARQLGMSTDVQWKSYVDAIAAVLPAAVSFDSLAIAGGSPMSAAAPATDPTQTVPSVGKISFTARSVTIPDTAAWVDALNGVSGFTNAWVGSVSITEDDHGAYYQVTASVQLTAQAFSHRFDITEGQK